MRTRVSLGILAVLGCFVACGTTQPEGPRARPNLEGGAAETQLLRPMTLPPPGTTWASSWDALGGTGTMFDPTIAFDGSALYAFYVDAQGSLLTSSSALGGAWSSSGWTSLGGEKAAGHVSIVRWSSYLAAFYHHLGDNHLHAAFHNGTWRVYDLGLAIQGDPAGVLLGAPSNAPEPLFDVYGFDSSGNLGHVTGMSLELLTGESDAWSAWQSIPDASSYRPSSSQNDLSVVSPDGTQVDAVFVRYGSIAHAHADVTGTWAWETVSTGASVARVAATSVSSNEVDLAWTDASGNAYEKTDFAGAWFIDEPLGGNGYTSKFLRLDGASGDARPAVAPLGGGILYAQTSAALGIESEFGGPIQSVSQWAPIGTGCSAFGTNPAMVVTAANRVDLLAVDVRGQIVHTWFGVNPTAGGAQLAACACGTQNNPCCGGGSTCGANLGCSWLPGGPECACGDDTQTCCAGATCPNDPEGANCFPGSHTCIEQGGDGQPCFPDGSCVATSPTLNCAPRSTTCVPQGSTGEPCLPGNACVNGGDTCWRGKCTSGGKLSGACLPDGTCDPSDSQLFCYQGIPAGLSVAKNTCAWGAGQPGLPCQTGGGCSPQGDLTCSCSEGICTNCATPCQRNACLCDPSRCFPSSSGGYHPYVDPVQEEGHERMP